LRNRDHENESKIAQLEESLSAAASGGSERENELVEELKARSALSLYVYLFAQLRLTASVLLASRVNDRLLKLDFRLPSRRPRVLRNPSFESRPRWRWVPLLFVFFFHPNPNPN